MSSDKHPIWRSAVRSNGFTDQPQPPTFTMDTVQPAIAEASQRITQSSPPLLTSPHSLTSFIFQYHPPPPPPPPLLYY